MSTKPCALCGSIGPLRLSHIIPEFLYKPLYDDKHRFREINVEPDDENKIHQKGARQYLLCDACEQLLNTHETYASKILHGGVSIECTKSGSRLHLSDIDYTSFKLFQLSILWRASVSTLPIFEQVALGPHEERLRRMILASDPGSEDLYGCLMFAMLHEKEFVRDAIMQPTTTKIGGQKGYRFVMSGFTFVYIVSSSRVNGILKPALLRQNGSALIVFKQIKDIPFIVNFARGLEKAGKLY